MEAVNLTKGFHDVENLSDKNREALKSDTWQKAGEALKNGISEMDADGKAGTVERSGFAQGAWKEAVCEYVRTLYKSGKSMCDIESGGVGYKVMKKDDKVTFYDASGNTLFNVGYEQLETEYAQMMGQQEESGKDCRIDRQIENTGDAEPECSDETEEACVNCEKAENIELEGPAAQNTANDNTDDNTADAKEVGVSAKDRAKKKLEKELEKAKDKTFAEPVIGYLLKRCEEDEGLAQDVIQKHKAWQKCFGYIYNQARKRAKGNFAAVRDDVVYEWAEDYYHLDDKALEEKKAREEAERKKKAAEKKMQATEKKAVADAKRSPGKAADQAVKKEAALDQQHETPKPRIKKNEVEGQMDMFSLMGI